MSDYAVASVLDLKFATIKDGVPTTLAGTPVVSVYKDNSTTQSTSGVSLTVDFDSITGCNNVRVDTSSDGTFYSSGSSFSVVITTGTVGGNSAVGFVIDTFTLNRGNIRTIASTSQTARDIGASVLLSSGTGTGQVDLTSGVPKSNLSQILGTALTETAGLLAGGFKKFFNVATPTGTLNSLPGAVAGAANGLWILGTNNTAAITIGNLTASAIACTTITASGAVSFQSTFDITGAMTVTGGITADIAGTIASVTTLSNLPSIPLNWITATGIASNAFTSAKFAAGALDAVWSTAARTLTAGTNIVLPSNGLSSVTAWTVAITGNITGTASGNATAAQGANLDATISSRLAASSYTAPPSAATISTAVWGETIRTITGGTIGTYTGNTPQTGDAFARIGATGSGLTSLATSAQAVKLLAATYDSATLSGSTLTLSNAATMTVSSTGRVTT